MVLLLARCRLTATTQYSFLWWNLFLAWIPLLCSIAVSGISRRAPRLVLSAAWLFFFPNAPYLLTDFVHFRTITGFAWWYDVGMLAIFACLGLMLALVSLRPFHVRWAERYGPSSGWWFVIGVALLAGFGVYLGRFLRLNSWDIVFQPGRVVGDFLEVLTTPTLYPRAVGMTLLFAGILLLCYIPFAQSRPPLPDSRRS